MNLLATLRQLKYPREFRINPPVWPPDLLSILEKSAQPLASKQGVIPPDHTEDQQADSERMRFLADVGTSMWRLRQKMLHPGTDRPFEEMRRAYRHLESIWDAFTQANIEIQDHTNELFDSGMSLKAITFQPMAGIGREMVIETIKPSIYFKGKVIQIGEVIVGTPDTPKDMQESKTRRPED